jgi:predicted HicB family RNase H-like nuclease
MNTMSYKGYTTRMDFDTDDKIIVGRVVDLDDIITFHGTSVAEFEEAFHTALDGYISACQQLKQIAEKPASGRLMLRIEPSIHASALRRASEAGQSLNKWAASVLEKAAGARLAEVEFKAANSKRAGRHASAGF